MVVMAGTLIAFQRDQTAPELQGRECSLRLRSWMNDFIDKFVNWMLIKITVLLAITSDLQAVMNFAEIKIHWLILRNTVPGDWLDICRRGIITKPLNIVCWHQTPDTPVLLTSHQWLGENWPLDSVSTDSAIVSTGFNIWKIWIKSFNEIPSFLLNIFSWDFCVGCFTIDKRLELEDESPYRMRPRALLQNFQHTSLHFTFPSALPPCVTLQIITLVRMEETKMSDQVELKTYLWSAFKQLSCRGICPQPMCKQHFANRRWAVPGFDTIRF